MRIPVHVVGNIKIVVLVAVFILEIASAVHDADKTARIFHLGEPGSLAVEGHIRAAVGFVVDEARLAFAVQRRMRFPEGDCCFYKGGKLRIPGGCFPVDPAGFVVLAPGVVVALLAGMNMICNVFGLGAAATPPGLAAMERFEELEEERRKMKNPAAVPEGTANREMCTFLILNISSLQLIPVNIIAYRSQYGSVHPTAIVGPALAATAASTIAAVVFCKVMERMGR